MCSAPIPSGKISYHQENRSFRSWWRELVIQCFTLSQVHSDCSFFSRQINVCGAPTCPQPSGTSSCRHDCKEGRVNGRALTLSMDLAKATKHHSNIPEMSEVQVENMKMNNFLFSDRSCCYMFWQLRRIIVWKPAPHVTHPWNDLTQPQKWWLRGGNLSFSLVNCHHSIILSRLFCRAHNLHVCSTCNSKQTGVPSPAFPPNSTPVVKSSNFGPNMTAERLGFQSSWLQLHAGQSKHWKWHLLIPMRSVFKTGHHHSTFCDVATRNHIYKVPQSWNTLRSTGAISVAMLRIRWGKRRGGSRVSSETY